MAKKFSQFPSAASISPGDSVVGLKDGANTRFSFATVFSYMQNLFVPTSRKVNNKALTADITLDASDVGAVDTADVGVADGVASLDSNGKVPGTQLDLSGKQNKITANGILKGDGQGGISAATAGTDYQAPLTAGTDYATPAQLADKAAKADLTSIQATGTTNTTGAAIPAGVYFYLNGILYRAKTQIAVNATFTVNTNCEQVTAGGLNELKAALFLPGKLTSRESISLVLDKVNTPENIGVNGLRPYTVQQSGFYTLFGSTTSNSGICVALALNSDSATSYDFYSTRTSAIQQLMTGVYYFEAGETIYYAVRIETNANGIALLLHYY